jgi:anti-sigma factor RsiW
MNTRNPENRPQPESCTATEMLLAEYCAGDLEFAQNKLVEDHLDACPACRAELSRERFLRGHLEELPLASCPDRVTRAIMAEVDGNGSGTREPALPEPSRRWAGWIGGLAAAAAALLLLVGTPGQDPVPGMAPRYTPEEIAAARQDLQRSLLLTARILDRTERSTVKEVFGRTLPESLNQSLKSIITPAEGEQG